MHEPSVKNMKIRQLIDAWQNGSGRAQRDRTLTLALSRQDLARLMALAEMYALEPAEAAAQLLQAALDEAAEALPYRPGNKVVGQDEFGDPVYEDTGPTPRFLDLTRKYLQKLDES